MAALHPIGIAAIVLIGVTVFFVLLPFVAHVTDNMRRKARERCRQIVEAKGGALVSMKEVYRAIGRKYEYHVERADSEGTRHQFVYHPAYLSSSEEIRET